MMLEVHLTRELSFTQCPGLKQPSFGMPPCGKTLSTEKNCSVKLEVGARCGRRCDRGIVFGPDTETKTATRVHPNSGHASNRTACPISKRKDPDRTSEYRILD
jgi:hypothetical protein